MYLEKKCRFIYQFRSIETKFLKLKFEKSFVLDIFKTNLGLF